MSHKRTRLIPSLLGLLTLALTGVSAFAFSSFNRVRELSSFEASHIAGSVPNKECRNIGAQQACLEESTRGCWGFCTAELTCDTQDSDCWDCRNIGTHEAWRCVDKQLKTCEESVGGPTSPCGDQFKGKCNYTSPLCLFEFQACNPQCFFPAVKTGTCDPIKTAKCVQ